MNVAMLASVVWWMMLLTATAGLVWMVRAVLTYRRRRDERDDSPTTDRLQA